MFMFTNFASDSGLKTPGLGQMGGTNAGRTERNLVEALPLHVCATFLLMCTHGGETFYSFLHRVLSSYLHSQ